MFAPSYFPKTEPRRSKIDDKISLTFDHFLKASWSAIFSAKKRQKLECGRMRGRPGGMRSLRERVWERAAGELMSGTWLWKIGPRRQAGRTRRPGIEQSSTPSPVGRRIASRIPPGVFSRYRLSLLFGSLVTASWADQ